MLSNPETLAFYDNGNHVHIFHSVKKPFSSGMANWNGKKFSDIIVPSKSFKKLCKRFCIDGSASFKINKKKLSVQKHYIFDKTAKQVPKILLKIINLNKLNKQKTSYRIRLSYGSQWVYLWETTWEYLINNILKDN